MIFCFEFDKFLWFLLETFERERGRGVVRLSMAGSSGAYNCRSADGQDDDLLERHSEETCSPRFKSGRPHLARSKNLNFKKLVKIAKN